MPNIMLDSIGSIVTNDHWSLRSFNEVMKINLKYLDFHYYLNSITNENLSLL